MLAYGILGKILDVICSLYKNLQSCGSFPGWFSQSAGVRQGNTLANTLFDIFLNDLVILLFADYIVLISESRENLQTMMNTAGDRSNRRSIKMNSDKTKVIRIHKQSFPRSNYQFKIHSNDIETTASYRYLGLDINETMDDTHGMQVLNTAASRALSGFIARWTSTKSYLMFQLHPLSIAAVKCGVRSHMNVAPHSNTVQ